MRLALLSDIHGNSIALDAVLADAGEVDGYRVVGDLAAIGHDPAGCLERLTRLRDARFVRGNTDRYTATGARPGPTAEQVAEDPRLLGAYREVAATFAWTAGALQATRWLPWLSELPLEHRETLEDGTRVLYVHAAPGDDDGPGVRPTHSDDELRALVAGCGADLVVVGHTHWQLDRTVDGVRVVNLGSVSNPSAPDVRASYYLLEEGRLEHRRVEYDHAATITALDAVRHPAGEYIKKMQRGEHRAAWVKE